MPAKSARQQRAAGADVARCKKGQSLKTFDSCAVARDYARSPKGSMVAALRRGYQKAGR
jgi:hypothetical protein